MRSPVIIFLACVLGMHVAVGQIPPGNGNIIKVLTFNVLHGATTNGDFDLDVIAKVIIDADPDLVALQEVDFMTNRVGKLDLATELGWRTKMAPLFGRAMQFDGGEYGVAILSKFTYLKTVYVPLPHSKGMEPRVALIAQFQLLSGDTIQFISTHLSSERDETDRVAQVKKINEMLLAIHQPVILAGDLNAKPGSVPIKLLEDHWQPTYDKSKPANTFPSSSPSIKIDYVMTYPLNRWKVVDAKVIDDPIASDHCAYLVTLKLTERR